MDDLDQYHQERIQKNPTFWQGEDQRYEEFKLGTLLKEARQQAGLSQEEIAKKLGTTKSVISRMENHAKDIRFSTLEKVAQAVGKKLVVTLQEG